MAYGVARRLLYRIYLSAARRDLQRDGDLKRRPGYWAAVSETRFAVARPLVLAAYGDACLEAGLVSDGTFSAFYKPPLRHLAFLRRLLWP